MTAFPVESRPVARARSEWSGGWKPLAAGFLGMSAGWNLAVIVSGLFLKPMEAEFGWSRTELSYGPIAALIVAFLLPFSALLLDRFGSRRVAILGLVMLSSAYFVFSIMPDERYFYYGAVLWLALGGAVSNSVIFARGVAPWFAKNLGLAIGLMMTGASVGAVVGVPALAVAIEEFGWRSAMQMLGTSTLLIGLPFLLLWFREPPSTGSSHGASLASERDPMCKIIRRADFWQVAVGSFIAALPIGGFIGHLVPLLTDHGIGFETAAGFGSLFAVSIGIGRIANGFLLDRLHPPLVTFTTLSLAALGCIILATLGASPAWILLAVSVALIGVAQGAEGDYIKFFSMRLFGVANFSRVVAIMAMTISAGMALGGLAFARVFDVTGSYGPAVQASIALYAVGGIVFLTIKMRSATT